jgi:hypothetical protein
MPDQPLVAGSGEWTRTRTDEQLREAMDGAMPSPFYEAVRAELERRERDREAAVQRRWIKRTFWVSVVLGLGGILATLLT